MTPTMTGCFDATSSSHWLSLASGLASMAIAPTIPNGAAIASYRSGNAGLKTTASSFVGQGTPPGRDVSNKWMCASMIGCAAEPEDEYAKPDLRNAIATAPRTASFSASRRCIQSSHLERGQEDHQRRP